MYVVRRIENEDYWNKDRYCVRNIENATKYETIREIGFVNDMWEVIKYDEYWEL